jgi:hypothetical protein
MKRLFAAAAVAGLTASGLVAVSASGDDHHGSSRIVVHESATFTSQTDNGAAGPSAGDMFTFTGKLTGDESADEAGVCTLADATTAVCSVSETFEDGQLVLEGSFSLTTDRFQIAIVGGTGEFARARGWVDVHTLNAEGTEADLVIHVLR